MPQARGPQDRVPQPGDNPETATKRFTVDMPGTGVPIELLSADEVRLWDETVKRYIKDYRINKTNDQIVLGALVSQVLVLYRAQSELVNPKKSANAQEAIKMAADEIRKAEKALGIDKATREKGGQHTVADYIIRLKRAAYEKGVHISQRVKAYEQVCMDARWRIRLFRNGDEEDKSYHKVQTPEQIIDWLERELGKLEELDKAWAKERASVWVGKL